MSENAPEAFPIYLRVLTVPTEEREKHPRQEPSPNDDLVMVLDCETTTDRRQELRFGVARVYAFGKIVRSVVYTGKLTEEERATVAAFAEAHGFEVMPVERFTLGVLLPFALDQRGVVVGFNLPFDLSRLAVDFAPKRNVKATEAWTLRLLPPNNPKFAYVPPIRIQHVDSRKAFISFGGTRGKRRGYRGAFVDLRTLTAALTGEGHSLASAGVAFGCSLKKTGADYDGPVTEEYLTYGVNDVDLTHELYRRCLARYAEFGLAEHPSRVFSSASLGKFAFAARGVSPPSLPPELTGRIMASFYAGKVECRVVKREVPDVAILDVSAEYPSLFCLLRADDFLSAEKLESHDATEDVRSWAEGLTLDDLMKRETWADPRMWSLCEVSASDDLIPIRSPFAGKSMPPTIGWSYVTTEPGFTLPYLLPDVLAAKLLGGKLPRIVKATTISPIGRQRLSSIRILGATVGPSENLIQKLAEARIVEKRDKHPGWEARALGLKILVNAASYGVFVEVNAKREAEEMRVVGLEEGGAFEESEARLEEPGALFCPVIGATITSGAHLLLALLDAVAAREGAEVVYQDTDSAFLSPSAKAGAIARAFDALSPYSLPCPFLKDETPEADGPVNFYGLSSKRYALYTRKKGLPVVLKASDHGLGAFQVPGNRETFVKGVWRYIIRSADHNEPLGMDGAFYNELPATAQFSLTSPSLYPRVAHITGIRPFSFFTVRYLTRLPTPEAPSYELLPFTSTDDAAWDRLAREPGGRTWMHVLMAFVAHTDRKFLRGHDGRAIRRRVLARRSAVVGLGKEGGRMSVRVVLGKSVEAPPSVFVNWKPRLLGMGRAEARERGLPWRRVKEWKQSLRASGELRADALSRLRAALLTG